MSSQSSPSDYIRTLQLVQTKLYQIGGPILISIGTISCIFSLIIFTRKNLRKNPCSIYFIASDIANLLLIYTSLLVATLSAGYKIAPSAYSLGFCRCSFYMQIVLDALCPSYLILASIDRVLITSRNARLRRYSTCRFAYISIVSLVLFWGLFHSPVLMLVSIIELAPNYFLCYFNSPAYLRFIAYYALIVKPVLLPLTMIVFGLWCMKNIRDIRRVRMNPVFAVNRTRVGNHLHSVQSRDRQLIRILFINIITYVILILMPSVVTMYQEITRNQTQDPTKPKLDVFLLYTSAFSGYIPFCIGFYTNLFVSKTFRNEFKNALLCK